MHATQDQPFSKFYTATEADYGELTELWEASARETHGFVASGDIEAIKRDFRERRLSGATVVYTRDGDGAIAGFVGVAGDKIEMMFVLPKYIGMSIGKRLFMHAVFELRARRLDVNEQNESAVGFYLRQGCRVVGRSAVDADGRPYPVLHMECLYAD